jgi:FAD/FMN-containing dehydrogenase
VTSLTDSKTDIDFGGLRSRVDLDVFTPDDPGYDSVRMSWNTVFSHRPLAVVVPVSASGVLETVRFARANGISIAIQSTGHGPTREAHDAILINMARMTDVVLDVDRATVRIGGGAKWQPVLDVVTPHGLAPLVGSTPDVSAVGYTLGGGLGWLARKYGTSADSVISFDVVTADGQLVRASATENPELFWGLRGGGAGALGVITAMEVQLYHVPQVYGGNLFYPAEMAGEVVRRWRDWVPSLPEDITAGVNLFNFPAIPDVPENFRGRSFVLVRGAYDGPMEEGEKLLSYWRRWRTPEFDLFGPMPFERIADVSMDPLDPLPIEVVGMWLRSLSDSTIDELIGATLRHDELPPILFTEMRHAGGAISRGGKVASAFGNRDASILLEMVAVTPTKQDIATVRDLTAKTRQRIAADLHGGVYLNFLEGDDRRFGAREGLGKQNYRRLTDIKAKVDPDDLFNHGIDATV